MTTHARALVADVVARGLADPGSRIVEVASHGGHLQPFFAESGVRTTVLEPLPLRAAKLRDAGGDVIQMALTDKLGQPVAVARGSVDLFIDHYLLAHLESPESAVAAVAGSLAEVGTAVVEFDHLLPTIEGLQFDAFRHGHRSYLSLTWLTAAAQRHGLIVTEVAEQSVYGGALRAYLRHEDHRNAPSASVAGVLAAERAAGLGGLEAYRTFAAAVAAGRTSTVAALTALADGGHPMMAYGAPARAVTLLNYYGLDTSLLPLTADASSTKQGRCMPGVRTPIVAPNELQAHRPSDLLILAWDLAPEIVRQVESAGGWGTRYWVPIPGLQSAVSAGARG